MPLEVNEIGIRLRVVEGDSASSAPSGTPGRSNDAGNGAIAPALLVDTCVRRVLQILAAAQER